MRGNLGSWGSLAYWQSGEWQVVKERLKDHEKAGGTYVPPRKLLFRSLDVLPFERVRCVIVGQDPYPSGGNATGIAFSVPETVGAGDLPPTLRNIFKEYQDDLGYPAPKNGDLTPWCNEGVLLWNAYPTAVRGRPGSQHWPEWEYLTQEILEKLDGKGIVVFIFLGNCARSFSKYINNSPAIETSHPSPLGSKHGFLGSKIFSRANAELVKLGQEPINWRLPCEHTSSSSELMIKDNKSENSSSVSV